MSSRSFRIAIARESFARYRPKVSELFVLAIAIPLAWIMASNISAAANVSRVQPFNVQLIEPTSPSESNFISDMNIHGVGVGWMMSGSAGNDRGLVFEEGQTRKLPALPTNSPLFSFSRANGINDHGVIVGASILGDTFVRTNAVMFTEDGIVDLGKFGSFQATANAINNHGQVVGSYGASSAFLWENGSHIDLGYLGPGEFSSATDINNLGHVVGNSGTGPFLWKDLDGNGESDPGEMIGLGQVDGLPFGFANAINDSSVVTGFGFSNTFQSPDRAFRWEDLNANHASDPGELVVLPLLAPDIMYTEAYDINNRDWVVGQTRIASGDHIASLWTESEVYDLNELAIWPEGVAPIRLTSAVAINDRGQIMASAEERTRLGPKIRVVLLSPVPEPSSMAIASIAVAVVLGWSRTRRR